MIFLWIISLHKVARRARSTFSVASGLWFRAEELRTLIAFAQGIAHEDKPSFDFVNQSNLSILGLRFHVESVSKLLKNVCKAFFVNKIYGTFLLKWWSLNSYRKKKFQQKMSTSFWWNDWVPKWCLSMNKCMKEWWMNWTKNYIEWVQRSVTRKRPARADFFTIQYSSSFSFLSMKTLEHRRAIAILCFTLKLVHGHIKLDENMLFPQKKITSPDNTRRTHWFRFLLLF